MEKYYYIILNNNNNNNNNNYNNNNNNNNYYYYYNNSGVFDRRGNVNRGNADNGHLRCLIGFQEMYSILTKTTERVLSALLIANGCLTLDESSRNDKAFQDIASVMTA